MTSAFRSFRFDLGQRFYLLLLGESLSIASAALMEFSLGIWTYAHSGSVTAFAGAVLTATWPPVLVLPVAGALADRLDRRYLIAGADLALACLLALLGILLWSGRLQLFHLYAFNCVTSLVAAFRQPAYQTMVADIVPRPHYLRATGLIGLSAGVSTMVAPLAAGFLMGWSGLDVMIGISLFAFVGGALLVLKSLRGVSRGLHRSASAAPSLVAGVFHNLRAGIAFFRGRGLMSWLLVYVMVQSSLLALSALMITPLVLAGHSRSELGWVYACGALGGLGGGLLVTALGARRRMMMVVVGFDLVLSVSVLCIGVVASTPWYCAFAFTALAASSVAEACVKSIWMRKVPARYQASIFSLVAMSMLAATSMTLLGGGLLADRWLEPALSPGGALADSVGVWLGTGKGRGVALLFVISGLFGAVMSTAALTSSRMRRLDALVPDGPAPDAQGPLAESGA